MVALDIPTNQLDKMHYLIKEGHLLSIGNLESFSVVNMLNLTTKIQQKNVKFKKLGLCAWHRAVAII